MVLDFDFFREQEDPDAINPETIRKMQKDRFKDVTAVDRVVAAYAAWRQCTRLEVHCVIGWLVSLVTFPCVTLDFITS